MIKMWDEQSYWQHKVSTEYHVLQLISEDICCNHALPSVLYRPKLYKDGDMWCALYGDDIQSGVCGFGTSPEKAMCEFNKNWAKDYED